MSNFRTGELMNVELMNFLSVELSNVELRNWRTEV